MKLYSIEVEGRRSIGAEWQQQVVDLPSAHAACHRARAEAGEPLRPLPRDMVALLRAGPEALEAARKALAFASRRPPLPVGERISFAMEEVKVLAPVPHPGKVLCPGVNFRGRLQEDPAVRRTSEFSFFIKVPSAVIGPGQAIVQPRFIRQIDYGVELAAVVGQRLRHVHENEVVAGLAGYTILHDVTARDANCHQLTLGKNFDTFCPIGPCLVTTQEIPDTSDLRLRTWVNGRLRQDESTSDWIQPLPRLIAALTSVMTLEPGDIVSSGTPAGCGVFQRPPSFLKPGDVVRMEIEGIGALENSVVAHTDEEG